MILIQQNLINKSGDQKPLKKRAIPKSLTSRKFIINEMKKNILILFALCTVMTSYSQTEKGKMFIGGSVNLIGYSQASSYSQSYPNNDFSDETFTITPNFAYFIKNNLAIGASLDFRIGTNNQSANENINYSYSNKDRFVSYGIGGFTRYYIDISEKFKLYISGRINYDYQTSKMTSITNDSISNSSDDLLNNTTLSVSGGLVYFITPKLGLEASFGNIYYEYSYDKDKNSPSNYNSQSNYGINLNPSTLYLGLNYYF